MEKMPRWELGDLYQDILDPQIEKDYRKIRKLSGEFDAQYRGKIGKNITAGASEEAIAKYEAIGQKAMKIYIFAYLSHATNSDKPEAGAFWQKTLTNNTAVHNDLLFFELEIGKLDQKILQRLSADKALLNYRKFLLNILAWKPHRLLENEEKIINDKRSTGSLAFVRLFNQGHSLKEYAFEYKGKKEKLALSEILTKLYAGDRKERETAAKTLTAGLKENLPTNTFIYNMIIQDRMTDTGYFKFSNVEDSRHKENEISAEVVDAMSSAISENYDLVSDFYAVKKKILGYEKLLDYDRYAPIAKDDPKISFSQAEKMVTEAYRKFSPAIGELADTFFREKWIDTAPHKGKVGGAFCFYGTPDLHPFVLVNYNGRISDVLTLAHELGHGIHACLSRKQTHLNFNCPLTLAETASVFGESLMFDSLKEKMETREEKRALYASTIEGIFSTVFRQNAMFLFERDVFASAKEKGELSEKEIGALWMKQQKEMYQKSVEIGDDYAVWWSYVQHFINTPFYVYAYCFGQLLALSLYAKYKEEGEAFVKKYTAVLEAGGSRKPEDLLLPLGIDISKKEFWEKGIGLIRERVEEFKSL